MGIRFTCPHCNRRLNVKAFLAGKRGFCPKCRGRIVIPWESEVPSSQPLPLTTPVTGHPADADLVLPGDAAAIELLPPGAAVSPPTSPPPDTRPTDDAAGAVGFEPLTPLAHHDQVPVPHGAEPSRPGPSRAQETAPVPRGVEPSTRATAPVHAPPAFPMIPAIAEAPQATWYLRSLTGQEWGPVDGKTVESWLREGRIAPHMYVWREGWDNWRLANEVFPISFGNTPSTWPPPGMAFDHAPITARTVTHSLLQYERRRKWQHSWWVASVVVLTILAMVLTVALVIVLRR